MRICSPQLGLSAESNLGGEVFDRKILEGLSDAGIKIEIILPKKKPVAPIRSNWNITRIFISHFPAQLFNLLIIPYLFKIQNRNRLDAVRLHQPQFSGLGVIFFKFLNKDIKIIATYHQFKEAYFWFFSKRVNNFWDHIICDSENVKQKIIDHYQVPNQKITVVHNGVPDYLSPANKDQKLMKQLKLKNQFVILFMGLFIKRKNPLFLLDVIAKVKLEHNNVVIIFWGTGPQKNLIIKKAASLNLMNNIRVQDPIFGPKKNLIHNLADVFVLPSLDEGFALAPLEAMACAKPVIMNKSHSASEAVVDGLNGFLCNVNDVNDWAVKIIKLIDNGKIRREMGIASKVKTIKEFQWKTSVGKHLEVLKSLNL